MLSDIQIKPINPISPIRACLPSNIRHAVLVTRIPRWGDIGTVMTSHPHDRRSPRLP